MKNEKNILWIDLETTGLDPKKCSILEVAAVVTTPKLFPIGIVEEVVKPKGKGELWEEMNDWCREQHTSSGLWREVVASLIRVDDAECQILALIERWFPDDVKPILGGQSVHFDRGFIREHMPELDRRLSHRHIDVTAFMEMISRTHVGSPLVKRPGSETKHRALDDILWSIGRMRDIADFYLNGHRFQ